MLRLRDVVPDHDRQAAIERDAVAVEIGRLDDLTEVDAVDVRIRIVVHKIGVLIRGRERVARDCSVAGIVERRIVVELVEQLERVGAVGVEGQLEDEPVAALVAAVAGVVVIADEDVAVGAGDDVVVELDALRRQAKRLELLANAGEVEERELRRLVSANADLVCDRALDKGGAGGVRRRITGFGAVVDAVAGAIVRVVALRALVVAAVRIPGGDIVLVDVARGGCNVREHGNVVVDIEADSPCDFVTIGIGDRVGQVEADIVLERHDRLCRRLLAAVIQRNEPFGRSLRLTIKIRQMVELVEQRKRVRARIGVGDLDLERGVAGRIARGEVRRDNPGRVQRVARLIPEVIEWPILRFDLRGTVVAERADDLVAVHLDERHVGRFVRTDAERQYAVDRGRLVGRPTDSEHRHRRTPGRCCRPRADR